MFGAGTSPMMEGTGAGTSWNFFLRPAGGRLGPLAESGSVLPVGECHEVYGQRTGRARQNFLRRRRQLPVAKLVHAVASPMGGTLRS